MPAHDHDTRLGLVEIGVGGAVDVAAPQRTANPELGTPGTDEVAQAALTGVAAGLGLALIAGWLRLASACRGRIRDGRLGLARRAPTPPSTVGVLLVLGGHASILP